MPTASVQVRCCRCGTLGSGKFCSECGTDLTESSPALRAVKTFTEPLWEFGALFKDVVMTRTLVDKVKGGKIDLQNVFTFSIASAAICGIIKYYFPNTDFEDNGPPLVGDVAICLAIIGMSAAYEWALHFFLRKKSPNVPLRQSIILMSCFFCVLVPLAFLLSPKGSDTVTPLGTAVALVLFFFVWRGQKLLYELRYRDIAWATAKIWLALLVPTAVIGLIMLAQK